MYCVIQFDDSGSNSLAVVHETWLTPLKREVFWPPFKDSKHYKRALAEGTAIDTENWKLFGVNRIFYQTDELEKAFKKEKEAETNSDLADTDIEFNTQSRQSRKICRRVLESSDSEEESRYSRPPTIKIKKLSGVIETKHPQNFGLKSVSTVQQSSSRKLVPPVQQSSVQNQPTQIQHTDEFSQPSTSFCSPLPVNNTFAESACKILISIVNQVKEQNKLIIGKLDEVQNTLLNKQGPPTQDVKDSFPVQLPLKNKEGLNSLEEHTKKTENFNLLVTHLSSLGGKNIKLRIHKVLRELLTDDLASLFSYYGKRSKEPFYELNINKALFRAIQSENTTISDVEDIIKLWIKHAPDRLKARNKTDAGK